MIERPANRNPCPQLNVRFPPKAVIRTSEIGSDLAPRFVGTFVGIPRVAVSVLPVLFSLFWRQNSLLSPKNFPVILFDNIVELAA
jgi:hypothetical protein